MPGVPLMAGHDLVVDSSSKSSNKEAAYKEQVAAIGHKYRLQKFACTLT